MKRLSCFGMAFLLFIATSSVQAQAADLISCGGGGQLNRLDPPSNPNGDLASGMSFGTKLLTGLKASKSDETTIFAIWDRWNPGNVGALENYYLYASSDGGSSWSCTRSYALSAQISGVASGVEIQVVLLARKGDTWAKSQVVKVSPVQAPSSVCPSKNYEFQIEYNEVLKGFFLVMMSGRTSADPSSENFYGNNPRAQFLKYTFEATVDNWKSKVVGKDPSGSKSFSSGEGIWMKPLDPKKPHTFRAIPVSSEISPADTTGCSPFVKTLFPKAKKADPCAVSVLDPNCKQEVVVGENAGDESQALPATATTVKSIKCQKGKLSKRAKGVNPKCPPGYKVKK